MEPEPEPEPVAAQPEPEPVEPEPEPVAAQPEPEPVAAQPEPEQAAEQVQAAEGFCFRNADNTPTGAVATSLLELAVELEACDPGVLRHHCPDRDLSRWVIFASGPDGARSRLVELFDALGQRTIWVGAVGAGTRLKLVNNTCLAFAAEAVATSIALARSLGLETETVIEALSGGPLVSPWQKAKLQRIASGEFSSQFALSLALKDVRLALDAAGNDRFEALSCLADEWQQAVDLGLGSCDLTVVTKMLEYQGDEPMSGVATT